jgi:hypothetical protein
MSEGKRSDEGQTSGTGWERVPGMRRGGNGKKRN